MSLVLCRTYKKPFYFQMSQSAHISIKLPLIWVYIAHSLNNAGLGGPYPCQLTCRLILFSDLRGNGQKKRKTHCTTPGNVRVFELLKITH